MRTRSLGAAGTARKLGRSKRRVFAEAAVAAAVAVLVLPALAGADSTTDMTFHGGPIMPTSTTYAIFWLPAGVHYEPPSGSAATDAANDANYMNLITRYFQDVGGSDIYNTTTQYPGSNGAIANNSTFGGSVVRTTAYPSAGTTADPLTNAELAAEVEAARVAQGWPTGLNAGYFIFTGYTIQSCFNASSCSTANYCAYHTTYNTGGQPVIWANMPDARSLNDPGGSVCDSFSPNGDAYADVVVNVTSHEHLEMVTDPQLNAWYDNVDGLAGENADKCAYTYGVVNDVDANIYMNGNPYRLQREWSNEVSDGVTAFSGCVMSRCGTSICSPVLSFTNTATPTTIAGNPSDSVDVDLVVNDPHDAEPARDVTITTTLPSGLTRTGGAQLAINVGDVGVHDTDSFTTVVSPSSALLDGTVLTISSTTAYENSINQAQPSITRTSTVTVSNAQPTLNLPGAQTADYHDPLTFGISASDVNAGDTIVLAASGLPAGLTFTDNGNRTGTVSGTLQAVPGVYTATFSASDGHHTTLVTGTVQITVTKEETTLTYTGPTLLAQNMSNTLTALLTEDDPTPVGGRTVSITVGTGGSSQTCSGVTNGSGVASCTINPLTVPQGPQPIAASFAGDTFYEPSSASAQAIVFEYLDRGSFVLGDATVAAATPTTTVTWWSSKWDSLNSLSGGAAPSSFKGFTPTLSSTPPTCGGTWTQGPGSSADPPAVSALPAYMATVVSSSITPAGSGVAGNIVKIVIVKTDPGYGPSAGKSGTGKIVATLCG
jgi:hypothetical protein